MDLFSILQSPHDGTPIGPDLKSEGGIQYQMTDSGILILDPGDIRPSQRVYSSPMFRKWDAIVAERIGYYTGKSTLAGRLSNLAYRSLRAFNQRAKADWLLDIGCGDGAQAAQLEDRSTYIGLDKNLNRLEILKQQYPEATAIYGDAASLPFKAGVLKHVYSCHAFEHIWYLKDAVMDLHRCMDADGTLLVVIPTEGGLWNLGRRFFSKPHFQKRHPEIDFEFISHVEHCNQAGQVIRSLETFFYVGKRFMPARIPSVFLNAHIELCCRPNKQIILGAY